MKFLQQRWCQGPPYQFVNNWIQLLIVLLRCDLWAAPFLSGMIWDKIAPKPNGDVSLANCNFFVGWKHANMFASLMIDFTFCCFSVCCHLFSVLKNWWKFLESLKKKKFWNIFWCSCNTYVVNFYLNWQNAILTFNPR